MQFLKQNLISATATHEDAGYPASNLIDKSLGKIWKLTTSPPKIKCEITLNTLGPEYSDCKVDYLCVLGAYFSTATYPVPYVEITEKSSGIKKTVPPLFNVYKPNITDSDPTALKHKRHYYYDLSFHAIGWIVNSVLHTIKFVIETSNIYQTKCFIGCIYAGTRDIVGDREMPECSGGDMGLWKERNPTKISSKVENKCIVKELNSGNDLIIPGNSYNTYSFDILSGLSYVPEPQPNIYDSALKKVIMNNGFMQIKFPLLWINNNDSSNSRNLSYGRITDFSEEQYSLYMKKCSFGFKEEV